MSKREKVTVDPIPVEKEKEEEVDAQGRPIDKDEPSSDEPKKVAKKSDEKEVEMSEEDKLLKKELDTLVQEIVECNNNSELHSLLKKMAEHIQSSTSSMTSVPKPLKFLRGHFEKLKSKYNTIEECEMKKLFADILSVLAMTIDGEDSLAFKLAGAAKDVTAWGHEYMRTLAGDIAQEYQKRKENEEKIEDLLVLVNVMVPYYVAHNAESEACDLLLEVERVDEIKAYLDKDNFERVCRYLASFANFVPEPEDAQVLQIVLDLYRQYGKLCDALRYAIRLGQRATARDLFNSVPKEDTTTKSQMAYMLGEQRLFILDDDADMDDDAADADMDDDALEALQRKINNAHISEAFLILAEDLDVLEPKLPKDIYKSHLENTNNNINQTGVDSARQNLASTFVNAFVNAGFGHDRLMTDNVGHEWIYKNKEHGMMSAAASLGLVMLWDVDGALSQIDTLLEFSSEKYIQAGALLSVGVVNSGVRHEVDPALALLCDYLEDESAPVQQGALLGLGLAYAGSERQDVLELLVGVLENDATPPAAIGHAALALGLVFVGSGNALASETLTTLYIENDADSALLTSTHLRFVALGLGLVFLARQDEADVTIETLAAANNGAAYAKLTVQTCAYAGTGNVLRVQELLHTLAREIPPEDAPEAAELGVAVLGVSLIALGEPVGEEMSRRMFEHILQYGEPAVRRAVPLALALSNLSHPDVYAVDTLSKLSHDASPAVAQGAILGLGLVAAGTNNARVAGLLRALASYYHQEPTHLFAVRIAQGLTHLGKGLMTLSPFTSHNLLVSKVALGGVLAFLHACLDLENLVLGKFAHLFYTLVTAMRPRMLITYDEQGNVLNVPVRVGQAVDTVAQAGKRKEITGFQTHTTPVLLAHGERCELATDEYIAVTSVLEQVVILKENPNAPPKTAEQKKAEKQRKEERERQRRKRIERRQLAESDKAKETEK